MCDIIERAEAALEGVSDGPWHTEPSKYVRGHYVITAAGRGVVHATEWGDLGDEPFGEPDFRFAAAARALVPDLVSALKAARAEAESLRPDAEMWRGVQHMYRAMGGTNDTTS